jgi:phosphinothricin acetyltransferase
MVRPADPARDAAACAAIYALSVVDSPTSFEEVAPDAEEMAARIAAAHDWVVAEDGGEVAGYASATRFMERAAYRWAVSVSIFVLPDRQRRGLGSALYGMLLPRLAEQGFTSAMAGITLPNPGSVALHEAAGFRRAGLFEQIGYKAGAWRDVAWYQRKLGDVVPR